MFPIFHINSYEFLHSGLLRDSIIKYTTHTEYAIITLTTSNKKKHKKKLNELYHFSST